MLKIIINNYIWQNTIFIIFYLPSELYNILGYQMAKCYHLYTILFAFLQNGL